MMRTCLPRGRSRFPAARTISPFHLFQQGKRDEQMKYIKRERELNRLGESNCQFQALLSVVSPVVLISPAWNGC